jgi:hypothetical protein
MTYDIPSSIIFTSSNSLSYGLAINWGPSSKKSSVNRSIEKVEPRSEIHI